VRRSSFTCSMAFNGLSRLGSSAKDTGCGC
jgi:hypothetical protein